MQLCVYISHVKHIENFEDCLRIIPKPPHEYVEILDSDLKVNQTSLSKLKKYFEVELGINYVDYVERVYFGIETCEFLVPSVKDVETAYQFCMEQKLGFTLVTPYTGPKSIKKLREIFDYLSDKEGVEVVVNDFGVLQILITEYKSLKPIIGRLLIKIKRDPRFSVTGYDIANSTIKNKGKVEKNQSYALQNSSFENELFQQFLVQNGVSRLTLDSIPQGVSKKILKNWKLPVDLMWPWTYVTSGRNCAIAAHTDPSRSFNLPDKPCGKQCRLYEFHFESDKQMLFTVQRGNAVWMNTELGYNDYFKSGFERLIYLPYIPV